MRWQQVKAMIWEIWKEWEGGVDGMISFIAQRPFEALLLSSLYR